MTSPWTVQLDPPGPVSAPVTTGRAMLDLNSGSIRVANSGIDWGQAAVTAFMTQQGMYGNSPSDFVIPNRTITIPLLLGADDSGTEETDRDKLSQKIALIQREGGVLLRQRADGPAMYADIVDAQLTVPDVYGETGDVEPNVQLVLDCLPDFYGDEITLDSIAATGYCNALLTAGGETNLVLNPSFEYDTSGSAAAAWGTSGPTWLSPGATVTATNAQAETGSQSLKVVTTVTNLFEGAASLLSGSFQAGVPYSLSLWVKGNAGGEQVTVALGASGDVASRNVTLTTSWQQVTVTWTPTADRSAAYAGVTDRAGVVMTFFVDQVVVAQGSSAPTYFDGDSPGFTWLGARGNSASRMAAVIEGDYPARCRLTMLDRSGNTQQGVVWGFRSRYYDSSINARLYYAASDLSGPSLATLAGSQNAQVQQLAATTSDQVLVSFARRISGGVANFTHVGSYRVLARVYSTAANVTVWARWLAALQGSFLSNDKVTIPAANEWLLVDLGTIHISRTPLGTQQWNGGIHAQTASGTATVSADEVLFIPLDESAGQATGNPTIRAGDWTEIRGEGTYWGDGNWPGANFQPVVAQTGDLPRLPPSGLEGRACELLVRPTRGDLATLADGGVDAFTAQVFYRPCWMTRA